MPRTTLELQVPVGTWTVDAAHSSVSFTARHLMVSKVRGGFARFEATVDVAERPEDSRVAAVIEASSIDTGVEFRDNHLRSPDFLDVERYPSLTFRSSKVEVVDADRLAVTGDLTIRDVTREVVLDVEYLGRQTGMQGEQRLGFTATTEIDREDFGITWNQALESGGVLVGRRVKIELEIAAVRS